MILMSLNILARQDTFLVQGKIYNSIISVSSNDEGKEEIEEQDDNQVKLQKNDFLE